MLARIISRGIRKVLTKTKLDSTIVDFVSNMVRYAIVAFVIIAALGRIGVETTSFVAIIGAAGLAIGLALQGSLSNFASGVLLLLCVHLKRANILKLQVLRVWLNRYKFSQLH